MPKERTLMIIKPESIQKRNIGNILIRVEKEGFAITAMKMIHLTRGQAADFYAVHKDKPFFTGLLDYITSGPVIIARLERENAVDKWRDVIGSTDPKKAAPGTIRALYGESIERNAVHGSDSVENGRIETDFFFPFEESYSF
jgi:nucleoside-diphosphate kinase